MRFYCEKYLQNLRPIFSLFSYFGWLFLAIAALFVSQFLNTFTTSGQASYDYYVSCSIDRGIINYCCQRVVRSNELDN